MSKYLISLICVCMVFSLTSCGGRENGKAFDSQDKIIESGQKNDTYSEEIQPVQGSDNAEQEKSGNLQDEDVNVPVVYMTTEISTES